MVVFKIMFLVFVMFFIRYSGYRRVSQFSGRHIECAYTDRNKTYNAEASKHSEPRGERKLRAELRDGLSNDVRNEFFLSVLEFKGSRYGFM